MRAEVGCEECAGSIVAFVEMVMLLEAWVLV